MNRLSLRTPAGWSRFDFFALVIIAVLIVLLIILWIAGLGPAQKDCCSDDQPDKAMLSPSAPVSPTPTPLPPPEPYLLIVNKSQEGISISGVLAEEQTRMRLLSMISAQLSNSRPVSSLSVARNIRAFDSALVTEENKLQTLLALFPQMRSAQLSVDPQVIKLSGEVEDDASMAQVSGALDALKTSGYSVINNVDMVSPEQTNVTPAPQKKGDCKQVLRASQVEFAFGRSNLTNAGRASLQTAITCLSTGNYQIVGHTDAVGDDQANLTLSMERARQRRIGPYR